MPRPNNPASSQADKFKDAARELHADEDEKNWEERLKRVAKHSPDKETKPKEK